MNRPRVTFFRIKDNQSKLDLICLKAKESFEQEKKLLILVSTLEAGQYIDALLWRKPEEGFIPHLLTQNQTTEWIAITMQQNNINQAACVLNLQMQPISFFRDFEEIFELKDETTPEKTQLTQAKVDYYRTQGLIN